MNSKPLPLILSLLAVGLAAAAFVTGGGVSTGRPGVDSTGQPAGAEVLALRAEVAQLNGRLAELESRETLLAASPASVHAAPNRVSATPAIDPETLEEVRSVAAALKSGDGAAADQLANLIVEVVERREQEEQEAALAEQKQQLEERMQQQVAKLVEDLGMDKFQEEQVWKLLDGQAERRETAMEVFRSRDMERMDEARDDLRAMRTEADETFRAFLTDAQYEQFDEMGGARRLSNPGGGRGWGGGGGGRGGRGN